MTELSIPGRPARAQRGPAVRVCLTLAGAAATLAISVGSAAATEIRTHATNRVPACVTPDKLMAFLSAKNERLDPRFKPIARHYKLHGERWRVRWDYAFFQMAIETNFLAFHRPDGRPGDVRPSQNNFAGLGTTGGGVPGDSYPDVSTGVLAQIQHLVAYSGELLPSPVGPRTRLKQDDIVSASLRVGRPIRFADLARRWAVDPKYGRSIEWMAERYREQFCTGRDDASAPRSGGGVALAAGPVASGERSALGGEPQLVRKPALVQAEPSPHPRPDTSAVRTVWSRSKAGDVPVLPQSGPAPAPRRMAAVAAGTAVRASTTQTQPVAPQAGDPQAVAPPGAAATEVAGASITAIAPIIPPAPAPLAAPSALPLALSVAEPIAKADRAEDVGGRVITLSAAASPFAAGSVVAERQTAHGTCRIVMASYGGTRTVLIRATTGTAVDLVVLAVIPGFEASMSANFIRTRLPGGVVDGGFDDRDAALDRAKTLCPPAT